MKRIRTICLSSRFTGWLFLGLFLQTFPLMAGNPDPDPPLASNLKPGVVCELLCPGDQSFILASGECNRVFTYSVTTTGDCQSAIPEQTAGLPSGSAFPIGITHNCFKVDLPPLGLPDGDLTCCFDVIVSEYPNPTPLITCTDLAVISLDEDCQLCVGAGAVLEGGPYGCFDDYVVQLDKTVPYGNGPWVPACVGLSDVGKTYQVRVTEPVFGNKCWGSITIEDNQAPVLACPSKQLPCNFSSFSPENIQTATYTVKVAANDTPKTLNPGESYFFNLPVGVNGVVNDVDCRVNITNANAWNIQIEVVSPAGTTALIWDAVGGCGLTNSIFARFDDEGLKSNQCSDLSADLNLDIMSVLGFDSLSVFDGENAEGNWQIKISNPDAQGFGQVAVVDIAELYINQTVQFSAGFPNGLSGSCVQSIGNNQYLVPAGCGVPTLDNCANVTLSYVDMSIVDDCASGLTGHINRMWTAKDAAGNTSTCIQRIDQLRPSLTDVVFPPDYDGIDAPALSCNGGNFASPEWITDQGLQGQPVVFGLPGGCNINWDPTDNVIQVCDGTYKIKRNWTIIDWCTGEMIEHNQVIKVVDNQGPNFACPQSLTVSTDAFTCCSTSKLPDVVISDGCSRIKEIHGDIILFDPVSGQQTGIWTLNGSLTDYPGNNLSNPDTLGTFGLSPCLPKGTHTVGYVAEDDCGNTAACSFQLTVIDQAPPVAVCDEITVVAIGIDDPADCYGPDGSNGNPPALDACHFAGQTWVKASAFDDGSYDACGNLRFTIQRVAPYSDCILGLNATNGHVPCNDAFPDFPSEFEQAISESDSIKFYACEAGSTQSIRMRVYQLDAAGNIAIDLNGFPIVNECTIQLTVEDKINPVCSAPANVTVSCEQFDPSFLSYGLPTVLDNCCLDNSVSYQGQCGLTQLLNYSNFDTICNRGTIIRSFRALDCQGNTSQCSQRIVVNTAQHYFIHFPDDVVLNECASGGLYGQPSFFGEDCELLAVSYEDQVFPVVPDACFKIERTWSIINWCTFNPGMPSTVIPNPNPNPITNHPANLPGPIVSECGTAPPWNPTIVKINPTDPAETNYCSFWSTDVNRYEYKQIIKIIDNKAPVVANCPAGPLSIADTTSNNPALWHNVFNPNLPAQDLTEVGTNLSITSSDDCSGGNLGVIQYLLFLDLDNDGTQESVIQSNNQPGADTIRYNNVNNPGYLGGTLVTFDSRAVPTNQKWHFALENLQGLNNVSSSIRWNNEVAPTTYVAPQLPAGTHKVKWILQDQCGNQSVCEHSFTIQPGPTSGIETLDQDGFALYQNEPNPFSSHTQIGFRLPDAANATLSVFDVEGRLLFTQTDHYRQGLNVVPLQGEWLKTPGILYYKLESGVHVAWRKMVLIR